MKNCTFTYNHLPDRHYFGLVGEAAFELPVMCVGGGHCRTSSSSYRYHGLQRGGEEFSFWQYTISGAIALEWKGERRLIRSGEGMLLSVPEDHCYFLPPESDHWDSVYLNFTGRDCRRLIGDIRQAWGSHFPVAPAAETLRLAHGRLEELAAGKVFSPYEATAFATRFLMTLAEELAGTNPAEPAFLETIRLAVKRDPTISVKKMCRISGYSKLYFERLFKRLTGMTPAAYLQQQRLAHALELLRHTSQPVYEIAAACGFRDSAYFCRVFRRKFGMPPGSRRGRG